MSLQEVEAMRERLRRSDTRVRWMVCGFSVAFGATMIIVGIIKGHWRLIGTGAAIAIAGGVGLYYRMPMDPECEATYRLWKDRRD